MIKLQIKLKQETFKSSSDFWLQGKIAVPRKRKEKNLSWQRANKLNPHIAWSVDSNPGQIVVRRVLQTLAFFSQGNQREDS